MSANVLKQESILAILKMNVRGKENKYFALGAECPFRVEIQKY